MTDRDEKKARAAQLAQEETGTDYVILITEGDDGYDITYRPEDNKRARELATLFARCLNEALFVAAARKLEKAKPPATGPEKEGGDDAPN